jgi:hypothetical protein
MLISILKAHTKFRHNYIRDRLSNSLNTGLFTRAINTFFFKTGRTITITI